MKHWVLCPHPSHDVTLNLLSIYLPVYLCETKVSVKPQAAAFVKIRVFPERDSSAAQDHFLDPKSRPHGTIRMGGAAELIREEQELHRQGTAAIQEGGLGHRLSRHVIKLILRPLSHLYSVHIKCLDCC